MKIKSITDVITNSSSECFTYITEDSIDKLKKLINSILLIGGSNKTVDELFIIEAEFDKETVKEWYDNDRDDLHLVPSEEELYEYASSLNKSCIKYMEGRPVFKGISIKPKDPRFLKEHEPILKEINNLFKNDEFYV